MNKVCPNWRLREARGARESQEQAPNSPISSIISATSELAGEGSANNQSQWKERKTQPLCVHSASYELVEHEIHYDGWLSS